MSIKSDKTIYQVLEKRLREADSPITCVDLMEFPDVRNVAMKEFGENDVQLTTNKLSDALGFMWRRGLLTRFPAPRESRSGARYSYVWDKKEDARPFEPMPSPAPLSKKTGFIVSEYGDGVMVEFEKFIVLIRPKE